MADIRHDPEKWKRRAAQSQGDYKAGVMKPRTPWHEATAAAAESYASGVQAAITEGRFAKAATSENGRKQMQRASTLGAARYAPGIAASGDAYNKGFSPYVETIKATDLPPRGPKGDPANYDRSRVMGEALNARKREIKGQ